MTSKSKKSVSFIDEPQVIEFIKAKFDERKQLFNSRYEIGQMKLDHQRRINALFEKAFEDFKKKEYIQSMTQLRRHMNSLEGSTPAEKDIIRQQFMNHINDLIETDIEDLRKKFYKSEHYSSYSSKSKTAGGRRKNGIKYTRKTRTRK